MVTISQTYFSIDARSLVTPKSFAMTTGFLQPTRQQFSTTTIGLNEITSTFWRFVTVTSGASGVLCRQICQTLSLSRCWEWDPSMHQSSKHLMTFRLTSNFCKTFLFYRISLNA